MTIDEVCEVIQLPKFDAETAKKEQDPEFIELPAVVVRQLRAYVAAIADLYRDNVRTVKIDSAAAQSSAVLPSPS